MGQASRELKSLDVSKAIDKAGGDPLAFREFARAYAAAVAASPLTHADIDRHLGIKASSCFWTREDHRGGMPPRHHWSKVCELLGLPAELEGLYEAAEREVVATGYRVRRESTVQIVGLSDGEYDITAPGSEDAARWSGWGTALKPAWEPIVVARKPLAGTVARNVLEFGTGALNIDGCRVEGGSRPARSNEASASGLTGTGGATAYGSFAVRGSIAVGETDTGRWPPNVVLGTEAAAEMDRQSGVLTSGANPTRRGSDKFRDAYGEFAGQQECTPHRGTDSGGASRFFPVFRYEAKAAAHERPRLKDGTAHPTVKPVDLMAWLVRLVTPPSVSVLTCVDCGHEQSSCVPRVRPDVPAKAGRANAVLADVPPEGSREGAEASALAVPDLREDAGGWPSAEVLQHRVPGDSAAQAQGVHHLPEGVPGAPAYAEDVFGEVHGARHEAAPEAVRGVRGGVPAGLEQGALLFPDLLSERDRASQAQALPGHSQGLPDAVPAGSPDVEPAGLPTGAPQGDGRPSRPDAHGRRGSASPQRDQGRQPAGEPGGSDEAGSRPDSEAAAEADRLPALRGEDRRLGTCADCGGALARSERPGLVLDPFAGSGTTAEACLVEGFRCVLVEKDPAYAELIRTRLRKPIQPDMFGGAA